MTDPSLPYTSLTFEFPSVLASDGQAGSLTIPLYQLMRNTSADGCSLLVYNLATSSSEVMIGNQVLQSFYQTYEYFPDNSTGQVTFTLSDNAV